MELNLRIVKGKDIIRVTDQGDIDFERAKRLISEICSQENLPDHYVILIDVRKTHSKLSTTNIWYFAAEFDKHRNILQKRSAILVPLEDFDSAKFFELCAANRGFTVNAFIDFEEAVTWLMEPPGGDYLKS